jgi:hypothetical protein
MNALTLQRDADRARRLMPGLNDKQSVHTLQRYLAELEGQLFAIKSSGITERFR